MSLLAFLKRQNKVKLLPSKKGDNMTVPEIDPVRQQQRQQQRRLLEQQQRQENIVKQEALNRAFGMTPFGALGSVLGGAGVSLRNQLVADVFTKLTPNSIPNKVKRYSDESFKDMTAKPIIKDILPGSYKLSKDEINDRIKEHLKLAGV